jgi:3-isopropylmalate/(R)-2-methylmalate dehydratase large subunit
MAICTQTLLEAQFSARLGRPVRAGEVVQSTVDVIMAHDATAALFIKEFAELGCTVHGPERVMVTCDHFSPPARIDWAGLQRSVIDFALQHQLDLRMNQGICHQLLLEDPRVMPGSIVVGADSHTVAAGAVGSFATGLGATDILGCLATGETWFRIPESIRITFTGARRPWVMGRDLALHLLGGFGEAGASYRVLELWDHTDDGLPMDSRAAISCMATEMGAKAAMFVPDAVTADYIHRRNGLETPPPWVLPDTRTAPGVYESLLVVDAGSVDSLVASPHSPANVAPVGDTPVEVQQVYIGSCASGRIEDLAAAAAILRGRTVARGLKVIAVPSSVSVMQEAIRRGYLQTLLDAGVCVSNPSCGACGGLDKGILAPGETALMTSTRNFQGRLGPRDSFVYLASAATCAASAITGVITHPAVFWPEGEKA